MAEFPTQSRARKIFYRGSYFCVAVFIVLSAQGHRYVVNTPKAGMELSESVVLGKRVWERISCINRHPIHGEGADFAPKLGNVMTRWGVADDP